MSNKLIKNAGLAIALVGSSVVSVNAAAGPIDVFQDNIKVGSIEAFTGAASAAANWTRNTGAAIGPDGMDDVGQIFFYDSAVDGLTFTVMWNDTGTGGSSNVRWNIEVDGSTSNPHVLESDDNSFEFRETSNDNFAGNWSWGGWYDAGIIGGLTGDWEIIIDPVSYRNIAGLYAVDASGAKTALSLDASKNIVLKKGSLAVSEPAAAALFALGLLGFGAMRRKS